MKSVQVVICWVLPESGGKNKIPLGSRYSTVAKFNDIADKWPNEAWSVVTQIADALEDEYCTKAEMSFLVDDAPHELLYPGSKFELWEGKVVAKGEVV